MARLLGAMGLMRSLKLRKKDGHVVSVGELYVSTILSAHVVGMILIVKKRKLI